MKRKRRLLPEGAVGFAEWQSQRTLVEDDPDGWPPYYRWVANPGGDEFRVTDGGWVLWLWARDGFPRERKGGRRLAALWQGGGVDLDDAEHYAHRLYAGRCWRHGKAVSRKDAPEHP